MVNAATPAVGHVILGATPPFDDNRKMVNAATPAVDRVIFGATPPCNDIQEVNAATPAVGHVIVGATPPFNDFQQIPALRRQLWFMRSSSRGTSTHFFVCLLGHLRLLAFLLSRRFGTIFRCLHLLQFLEVHSGRTRK
jgi:hypothetical protein